MTARRCLPFIEDLLEHAAHHGLDLFRRFTAPPSQLRRGVKKKLPTGLALRILRCPAGFFSAARVLMATRFYALVVTMAMISSASDEQVFYGERCPS